MLSPYTIFDLGRRAGPCLSFVCRDKWPTPPLTVNALAVLRRLSAPRWLPSTIPHGLLPGACRTMRDIDRIFEPLPPLSIPELIATYPGPGSTIPNAWSCRAFSSASAAANSALPLAVSGGSAPPSPGAAQGPRGCASQQHEPALGVCRTCCQPHRSECAPPRQSHTRNR
jgi:hypothetical protein